MAEKKPVKKPVVKPAQATPKKVAAAVKPVAKPAAVPTAKTVRNVPANVKKPSVIGPSARNCPLVLDGEVDALDFSDSDCLTCSEFDCRFCESQHGSGVLKSRLFAGGEEDDEADDEGLDLDFGEGDEGGIGEDEEEGEEEF